jgi:hypothetical protein
VYLLSMWETHAFLLILLKEHVKSTYYNQKKKKNVILTC